MITVSGYMPHEEFYNIGFYNDCGEEMPRKEWEARYAVDIFSGEDDYHRVWAVDIDPQSCSLAYRAFIVEHDVENAYAALTEAALDPGHSLHDFITHLQDYASDAEDYMERVVDPSAILAVWAVTEPAQLNGR